MSRRQGAHTAGGACKTGGSSVPSRTPPWDFGSLAELLRLPLRWHRKRLRRTRRDCSYSSSAQAGPRPGGTLASSRNALVSGVCRPRPHTGHPHPTERYPKLGAHRTDSAQLLRAPRRPEASSRALWYVPQTTVIGGSFPGWTSVSREAVAVGRGRRAPVASREVIMRSRRDQPNGEGRHDFHHDVQGQAVPE